MPWNSSQRDYVPELLLRPQRIEELWREDVAQNQKKSVIQIGPWHLNSKTNCVIGVVCICTVEGPQGLRGRQSQLLPERNLFQGVLHSEFFGQARNYVHSFLRRGVTKSQDLHVTLVQNQARNLVQVLRCQCLCSFQLFLRGEARPTFDQFLKAPAHLGNRPRTQRHVPQVIEVTVGDNLENHLRYFGHGPHLCCHNAEQDRKLVVKTCSVDLYATLLHKQVVRHPSESGVVRVIIERFHHRLAPDIGLH
mmetsp:Transcript_58501/g.155692  ORF Transcript_58501/g.155692 Transcript_58501/m.155692 type:complete len:250 (+) Transcript_58501:515-1264(+)